MIKRPKTAASAPAPATEPEPAPAKKGKFAKKAPAASNSFASAFDEAKPGVAVDFPIGEFRVKLTNFELSGDIAEEGEEQGKLVAIATFEGVEDEAEGKKINSRYSLCDDDGEMQGGVGFIKKDLDILGYEDVTLADLEELLEQITSEEPEVVIKTKQNGQYINAYLQGMAE